MEQKATNGLFVTLPIDRLKHQARGNKIKVWQKRHRPGKVRISLFLSALSRSSKFQVPGSEKHTSGLFGALGYSGLPKGEIIYEIDVSGHIGYAIYYWLPQRVF